MIVAVLIYTHVFDNFELFSILGHCMGALAVPFDYYFCNVLKPQLFTC